jgi:hypothetical protein
VALLIGLSSAWVGRSCRVVGALTAVSTPSRLVTSTALGVRCRGPGDGTELTTVAVLTSLYPGVTVLLARPLLDERFTAAQRAGLGLCAAAVAAMALS